MLKVQDLFSVELRLHRFILCTRCSGSTAHEGGGCYQSIGSNISDAIIRSWLWKTATGSFPLGYFGRLLQVVDNWPHILWQYILHREAPGHGRLYLLLIHTSILTSWTAIHNLGPIHPRNTPIRTRTTMWGPSAPQQALLRASPCSVMYRKRVDNSVDKGYIHCNTTTHSMTHCPAFTHIRAQHTISSPLGLWRFLANFIFPQGSGLARPDMLGQRNNNLLATTKISTRDNIL